jgi:hypothetical protein
MATHSVVKVKVEVEVKVVKDQGRAPPSALALASTSSPNY